MLNITKRAEYAIIALAHLANNGQSSAKAIAAEYGLAKAMMANVLKALSAKSIVKSVRGTKGGYVPAVEAGDLDMSTVITAIEGPIEVVCCDSDCSSKDKCLIRDKMVEAQDKIKAIFDGIKVSDFVNKEA